MKSASKLLRYLVLLLFLFNCGSTNVETSSLTPNQKVYVLLRSEGSEIEINRLSGILNSEFKSQNHQSNINYYPPGKQWDINEIFSNSYENNYNYIVIIDQVAKFTIDGKTDVGGKYQIRSYIIKSKNPDWIDLGQKTCNVSVKESVDKFSKQIVNAVLPLSSFNSSLSLANDTNSESKITGIDYNQLKTSSEYETQIAELKKQLENEKKKTDEAITKKERLSKEYQGRLKAKKEQNKSIVVGLKDLRQEIEDKEKQKQVEQEAKAQAAEATRIESLKLTEQKELEQIAAAQAMEQERIKSETEKLAESHRKEMKVKEKERKNENLEQKKSYDVFLVIKGNEIDNKGLGDLKDYIEFDLLFANKKTNSVIFNEDTTIDKDNFLQWNKEKFKYLIIIEQLQSKEDDIGLYKLSTFKEFDSNWNEINGLTYNIYERSSLKEFSKKVLNSIK